MIKQSLSGEWNFRRAGANEWLPASVPGCVHTDLMALERIPDPFIGDNEIAVKWVQEADWEYQRSFSVSQEFLNEEHVFLVCDGLDTLADVRLNNQLVGRAENIYRQYRWEVKNLLQPGDNQLTILFKSPMQYVNAGEAERHMPGPGGLMLMGGPWLRKIPSHFGWDWGPMLPTSGIWKDLRLEGYRAARLEDVHIRQQHNDEAVTLSAEISLERWQPGDVQVKMQVTAPDGYVESIAASLSGSSTDAHLELAVKNPQLWWPNDLGEQNLYAISVSLERAGASLDSRQFSVGLRTIELRQEPDEWGKSFTFVVNGIPVFAKGSDWIPADSFPTRIIRPQLEHLIRSAAMAHQNMLRIWGGGLYESEDFYDLCDQYGILVWQDFMFACAAYPMYEDAFLENLHPEVVQNVRRLRHRASLALWCGNNEMEEGWEYWGWNKPEFQDLKDAYDRFFHHLLPEWVAAEDPDRSYWPSSPSSNTPFKDSNAGHTGDIHQWDVWHNLKPFNNYRETLARFVSEFGFQSLPALSTVAVYAEPADWNMTSYIMEHHQRNLSGNGKIISYMTSHFRMPKDFPSLVHVSQVLQAEAMRIGVEHWRRQRRVTSGTLYWQLNDCWPVASWSSIDYYGRWKALHYAARRFYAPVLLSVEDNGAQMGLYITNDATHEWKGQLRWSLETLHGEVLETDCLEISAGALQTTFVKTLDFAPRLTLENRRSLIFVCELDQDQQRLQLAVTPFVPSKHLRLEDPQIEVDIKQEGGLLAIHLLAHALARFVELSLAGVDVIFSDNYFDLPAARRLTVTCPLPDGWTVEQARGALRVKSLIETY